MGDLKAVTKAEEVRADLQKNPNYLVNPQKQYVYTTTAHHMETIKQKLPDHEVRYIGSRLGFKLSGIPMGGDAFIRQQMQLNFDNTELVVANIL